MTAQAHRAFPLAAFSESLLAWQRDPEHRPDQVGTAFAGLMEATGARGAYASIDAPPLPALEVGYGTLARRPEHGPTDSVSETPLVGNEGRSVLGRIWLEAPGGEPAEMVRLVALALDAAWSRAELQLTAERLQALDEASRAIAGVLDVDRVMQLIVDRVRDLVRAEYAALGLADQSGQITSFITSGISHEHRLRIGSIPRGRGLLGLIIREGRTYRIPEIARHPDSSGFPPEHPAMRSFLGLPIVVKGRTVGNLYLTNKRDAAEFSAEDEQLVEMFALHAGIAYENASLHEQVQRLAVVDERQRIGKDLHDGIIQSIYAVGLSLEDVPDLMAEDATEATARIDRAIDSLHVTIRDIRNFIVGLQPESAGEGGLLSGLATIVHEFRLNTLIDIELEADEARMVEPSPSAGTELLQICREALSNVARHAQATSVQVRLTAADDEVLLLVRDNGRGFDPESARVDGHFGLGNMRARAVDLGGSLAVESQPGRGTDIIVRVPLEPTLNSAPAGASPQPGGRL